MVLEKPKSSNEKIQRHLGSAGAITTLNAEGKLKTIKVKTERYVSGKKPDYVDENFDSEAENSSEQNSDDQEFTKLDAKISLNDNDLAKPAEILNTVEISAHDQHRLAQRHPQMSTSSAIHSTGHESAAKTFEMNNDAVEVTKTINKVVVEQPQNLSRAELSRQLLQQHDENLKNQQFKSKESTVKPHTGSHRQRAHSSSDSGSDSDDDDDEDDYTDSDEEHVRLKPVFVPKNERLTIQQKKEAEQQLLLSKQMAKEAAKQNKNRILNIIDKELRREEAAAGKTSDPSLLDLELMADELDTDDEPDDEMEYKKWSVRELERIKADKAERERIRSEKEELQMIHEMSDEKRLAFMLKNPKKITNKAQKGKYNFLQKYYHRGVYYLDKEEDVLKRNIDMATEDDNFDRSKLPKIMQVRNFGKASRTKYTHLVSEDTNDYLTPLKNMDPQANTSTKRVTPSSKNNEFSRPSKMSKK